MTTAYINRVSTGVPSFDVHGAFLPFASQLLGSARERALFDRMVEHAQIGHRYSVLQPQGNPAPGQLDVMGVYTLDHFPSTASRMKLYEKHACNLALRTLEGLGNEVEGVTHLIAISCTGMYAPGLDLDILHGLGLPPSVERTCVGFMGCNAAINGLKLSNHIVRSQPAAKVLMVNLELCSLHLQRTSDLRSILAFVLFADGCAAATVSAEPRGLAIDSFHSAVLPKSEDLITWKVRDSGFEMFLSGRVPGLIQSTLAEQSRELLGGQQPGDISLWAVHPGGRSILDGVAAGLQLEGDALAVSRRVLWNHGNMSSATVMFVLEAMMADVGTSGHSGCAMAFGPGLSAETMLFHRS